MTPSFSAAVSALVYSIVRERCAAQASFPPNLAVDYVLRCHRRLPDFMRLPLRLATLGLDSSTLLTTGRALHQLDHPERWKRIEAWRTSRIGPVRSLLRFYEGLAIFGACENRVDGDTV